MEGKSTTYYWHNITALYCSEFTLIHVTSNRSIVSFRTVLLLFFFTLLLVEWIRGSGRGSGRILCSGTIGEGK